MVVDQWGNDVIEASEVVDLVMTLVLVPIVMMSTRALPHVRRSYVGGVACGDARRLLSHDPGGVLLPRVLNAVEHTCYAVAGVMALLTLLEVRRALSEYER